MCIRDRVTIDNVSADGPSAKVEEIILTSGNITTLVVDRQNNSVNQGDSIAKVGTPATTYETDSVAQRNVYYLDDGNGSVYLPDLTLYSGNKYRFNNASQTSHPFRFSQFRDGTHPPSAITGVTTTVDLSTSTKTIVVNDTGGIVVGMAASSVGTGGGSGGLGVGTFVQSVDSSTQLTLTEFPTVAGPATLEFNGFAYTENVNYESGYSEILVEDTTPSPLYYFCAVHPNMGGLDQNEATLTVNTNNPKVFGSGFSVTLTDIVSSSAAAIDIGNRRITTEEINYTSGSINT